MIYNWRAMALYISVQQETYLILAMMMNIILSSRGDSERKRKLLQFWPGGTAGEQRVSGTAQTLNRTVARWAGNTFPLAEAVFLHKFVGLTFRHFLPEGSRQTFCHVRPIQPVINLFGEPASTCLLKVSSYFIWPMYLAVRCFKLTKRKCTLKGATKREPYIKRCVKRTLIKIYTPCVDLLAT